MLPPDRGEGYANVWLGTTTENQEEAERRVVHLNLIKAPVRFLSCEPLLGPISLKRDWLNGKLHWIIAGGESGPKARLSNPEWIRSLRDQCAAADVAFYFKQWGTWGPESGQQALSMKRIQLESASGFRVSAFAVASSFAR